MGAQPLAGCSIVRRVLAGAFAQSLAQGARAAVLAQKVAEGLFAKDVLKLTLDVVAKVRPVFSLKALQI